MSIQRRNLLITLAIAVVYVAAFIPVNQRCSQNHNMLLCAGSDEYYQYPFLMAMGTRQKTLFGTVKNVIDHKHYYYGYPFYFVSAAAIAPLRVLAQFRDGNYTQAHILALRQLSPLFIAAAIFLIVAMWTGFHSLPHAASMFVFLAALPSVIENNTWWHPDGMVTFFIVATIFCLSRDNLQFGKWFYWSAVACGVAISTKVIGIFFVVCIPAYLACGVLQKKLPPIRAVRNGAIFVALMLASVVVTYPVLLIPHKNAAIRAVMEHQTTMNNFGWGVRMEKGPLAHYTETLRLYFGLWPIYGLALVCGVIGLRDADKKRRVLTLISLAWSLPFLCYLLFVVARKSHYYFIPVLLPLFPLLWLAFVGEAATKPRLLLRYAVGIVLIGQFALFLPTNFQYYSKMATEERDAPALVFYQELLDRKILNESAAKPVSIFRDPYVYLPPVAAFDQRMKWGAADYSDIRTFRPDFIMLLQTYIDEHSAPGQVEKSFDKKQAQASLRFYRDAKENKIEGYRMIYQNQFATAYERVRTAAAAATRR